MKSQSPSLIVFLTSLISSLTFLLLFFFATHQIEKAIEYAAIFWAINFVLSYFFFRTYILTKIAQVYRLVFPQKKQLISKMMHADGIDQMHQEIEAFNEKKRQELSSLKEKEVFQKEFIGNLAHELKTPAFNIQGYILTLLEGGLEDARINEKYLQRAAKSVDRMIQILDDLDTISKFDHQQLTLEIKACFLNELLLEVIDEFKLAIEQAKANIILEIAPEIKVLADKKRIKQVFINLINNSIKYSSENVQINIKSIVVDKQIMISIKDNGPGIAPKHLNRLFERFYRVEESRSRHLGGSGLGLSIVKSIIEKHGSQITVSSTLDEGTSFSFQLNKA